MAVEAKQIEANIHDCSRLDRAPSTLVDGQVRTGVGRSQNRAGSNIEANGLAGAFVAWPWTNLL